MDAIADCLYEETREGDNKAWIRGTEDARSGSIEFVFDIGDKRFRVVRTRTKSGRATLNISQKDGEEWLNLSAERIKDTQAEIEKILGMDSMTFRSCALIQILKFVAEKGNPDGELENLEKEASEFDQIRKMTEQDIEVCKKQIADRKEAQDKSTELLQSTDTAKKELLSIQSEKEAAEKEMETCDVFSEKF